MPHRNQNQVGSFYVLSKTAMLHGGAVYDNGDVLTYGWVQTDGAPVTLTDASVQASG